MWGVVDRDMREGTLVLLVRLWFRGTAGSLGAGVVFLAFGSLLPVILEADL